MKITKENIEAWLLDLSEGNLTPEQEKEVRAFLRQHPELHLSADGLGDSPTIQPLENESDNWNSIKKDSGWPRIEKEKEDFLIGKLEGTLTPEQENELNDRLLNDEALAREWVIYRALKLAAKNESLGLSTFLKLSSVHITIDNHTDFFIMAAETGDADLLSQVNSFVTQHPQTRAEWETVQQLKLAPSLSDRMPFKEQLKKRETRVAFLYNRRLQASVAAVAAIVVLFFGWGWFTQNDTKPVADNKIKNTDSSSPENTIGEENKIENNNAPENIMVTPQNNMANRFVQPNNNQKNRVTNKDSVVVPDVNPNTPNVTTFVNNKDNPKEKDTATVKSIDNNPSVTKNAFYKDSATSSPASNSFAEENTNFLTMKNVVSRVSKGFIEVDRKKDDDSKEFYLRIGKTIFHRKKKLDNQ